MKIVDTSLKAFLYVNYREYFNYDVFLAIPDNKDIGLDYVPKSKRICNNTLITKIGQDYFVKPRCDSNFVPKKGMSCFVAPGCKYPIDAVRTNYSIKKKLDTGDFNLISPVKCYNERHMDFYNWNEKGYVHVYVSEYKKFILINLLRPLYTQGSSEFTSYEIDVAGKEMSRIVGANVFDIVHLGEEWLVNMDIVHPAMMSLIDGTMLKPAVYVDGIDYSTGNSLTTEELLVLINTMKSISSEDNVKNVVTELGALNQYDWRDYPFTMSLIGEMARRCDGVFSFMHEHGWSRYSKAVRPILEMLSAYYLDKPSQKDWEMAKSIIDATLGGVVKYTTIGTLRNKLSEAGISEEAFAKFYGHMIRLTPKTYDEVYTNITS